MKMSVHEGSGVAQQLNSHLNEPSVQSQGPNMTGSTWAIPASMNNTVRISENLNKKKYTTQKDKDDDVVRAKAK